MEQDNICNECLVKIFVKDHFICLFIGLTYFKQNNHLIYDLLG